jgi:hypothetical protein
MKRLAIALIGAMFAVAAFECPAESSCALLSVSASVETPAGELTLADLLEPGLCPPLHQAAARVSLGSVPNPGSIRVLEGQQIRRLIREMEEGEPDLPKNENWRIPDRIVVRRGGRTKSCADIAGVVAQSASEGMPSNSGRANSDSTNSGRSNTGRSNTGRSWEEHLECGTSREIPEDSELELVKTSWNPRLRRWEFVMRCNRPEDCVPFLVWAGENNPPLTVAQTSSPTTSSLMEAGKTVATRLVKAGQTATLIWEQTGIRIVVPVICLDGGGLGQFVRVRFKNAAGTLRAEVMGAGTLRASL